MLQDFGLAVSQPLAVFWQGWGVRRGAVVTQAVPPKYSLADLIVRGDYDRLTAECRRSLIHAALEVIERFQKSGLAWRSMKPKHFYPEQLPGNQWRVWLIDCEGIYRSMHGRDLHRGWRDFLRSSAGLSPTFHEAVVAVNRESANLEMPT